MSLDEATRAEVRRGLAGEGKQLPPRLFYDDRGSSLFDEITEQPEYYLTDTEREIFRRHADDIVAELDPGTSVVELGSGSADKTRLLLEALAQRQDHVTFRPIDISAGALEAAAERLRKDHPEITVEPLVATYTEGLKRLRKDRDGNALLIIFMGSSIGNMEPQDAVAFLSEVRDLMEPTDRLLLGTDLQKDPQVLEAAYNDAAGVTAEFNKNVLRRLNRDLDADFHLDRFRHHAFYNPEEHRVEMHLVSTRDQVVHLRDLDLAVNFTAGERLHTENSYKYTLPGVDELVKRAGLVRRASWFDERRWFAEHLLAPNDL